MAEKPAVTKSEIIQALVDKQPHLGVKDIELSVKAVLKRMTNALADGERIEIRGFGSFCLHHRPARMGRNPRTGDPVHLPEKYVPHFKPGKALRERVNNGLEKEKSAISK